MQTILKSFALFLVLLVGQNFAAAQVPYPGWSFFNESFSPTMSLVDLNGNVVHNWQSEFSVGVAVYLLDEGKVIRGANDPSVQPFSSPGTGGRLERIAWDGTVEWSFPVAGPNHVQHHDIAPLPNGNVLCCVFERYSREEAIAAGRDPATIGDDIWSEAIYEVEPIGSDGGNIVWSWHVWDHLIQDFDPSLPNFGNPADHPEKVDLNYYNTQQQNWLFCNAIDYNAELDQIVISLRNIHEAWVISHAANSSGDLLYRYGNPAAYRRGTAADQSLWGAHHVHWTPPGLPGAGNLVAFNNGFDFNNPRGYSSLDEIVTPLNNSLTYDIDDGEPFQPTVPTSSLDVINGKQFYSDIMSTNQRLPNGNTFVSVGRPGLMYEVDAEGNSVWEGTTPQLTYRAARIGTFDTRLEGFMWESVGSDTLNVTQGLLWSGGLTEIATSDDQYLELRRNSGPVELDVTGDSDVENPSQITAILESRHSISVDSRRPVTVERQIELFNFETSAFEVIGAEASTIADSVFEININSNPGRFIDTGTGTVQARVTFTRTGLARGMRIEIDHLDVRVVR